MSEGRSFAIHANLGPRCAGLILLLGCGAWLSFMLPRGGDSSRDWRWLLPAPPGLPGILFGTVLMLGVSAVRVDPRAETLTRRKGIWPFVRETSYAFSEVEDVLESSITSSKGRTYNQLRVRFVDGTEWELYVEFHTGTQVRALGERLSALTDVSLTSA